MDGSLQEPAVQTMTVEVELPLRKYKISMFSCMFIVQLTLPVCCGVRVY